LKSLQFLRIDAPCRIVSFENEDDEQLAIIEYNRQREKNTIQIYNEGKIRKRILENEAKVRQDEAGKYGIEGGRGSKKEETLVANFPQGFEKEPQVREQLSEAMNIPQTKLDTILELGELAGRGRSIEDRGLANLQNPYENSSSTLTYPVPRLFQYLDFFST
jgi:hypothetical protein